MAGPWEQFQSQPASTGKPWEQFSKTTAPATVPPKDDSSFLGNVASGFSNGLQDLLLGFRQRGAQVGSYLEDKLGGQTSINQALGIPTAESVKSDLQRQIDAKRIADAPLLATTGGKVGNFASRAVPAALTALIPGGATLGGAILGGGALGAIEPTSGDESVLRNAAGGAIGGGLGYGVAQGASALLGRAANKLSAAQQLNAVRDATAAAGRDLGYVVPPVQTNPTVLNRTLEGLAGKLTTGQSASIKNQAVTNRTIATALGLDPAKPITKDALNALRQQAGQAYEAVAGIGDVVPGQAYNDALDAIVKPYTKAAQSFPNAPVNPIVAEIDTLRSPTFDAGSAVAKIRELRGQSDKAYAQGDKELGKALKSGAQALEDAIDSKLQTMPGASDLLDGFRQARQLIAKTYTVENALNESTGNVAARKLASQLARGKPLSGDIKTVAQFAQAFPKAADEVASSMPGVSPLDFYGAGGLSAITGNPASMLAVAARPAARATILSQPFQRAAGTPNYDPGLILRLLGSQGAGAPLQGLGVASGIPDQLSEDEKRRRLQAILGQ